MLVLSACVAGSLGSSQYNDKIVLTSAEQRAVTVVGVDYDPKNRRINPRRVLCAEPSPDIAKAVSSALESSLKVKGEGKGVSGELDASVNRTFTESIAQLGSRLATIQLLRDELSDLCRAYANGAVSSITYTLRLSRLDKKMITLLVSEASAGALSRALVGVSGGASIGGHASPEALNNAEKRIREAAKNATDAAKALSDANVKLDESKDDQSKAAAKKAVSKAEEDLRNRLSELNDRVLEKWALETRGTGLLAASSMSAVAGLPAQSVSSLDLRSIHRSYLEDDDLGTLLDACLTSLEDNAPIIPVLAEDQSQKETLDKKQRELVIAQDEEEALTRPFVRLPNAPPPRLPSDEERKAIDRARQKVRLLNVEVEQITRSLEGKSSERDRTGLLTFCGKKGGMFEVVRLIERKMNDRYWREYNQNRTDVCKKALESKPIQKETIDVCLGDLKNGSISLPPGSTQSGLDFGPSPGFRRDYRE
jgi:hypothetical protein